jgi:hypothetical protein
MDENDELVEPIWILCATLYNATYPQQRYKWGSGPNDGRRQIIISSDVRLDNMTFFVGRIPQINLSFTDLSRK